MKTVQKIRTAACRGGGLHRSKSCKQIVKSDLTRGVHGLFTCLRRCTLCSTTYKQSRLSPHLRHLILKSVDLYVNRFASMHAHTLYKIKQRTSTQSISELVSRIPSQRAPSNCRCSSIAKRNGALFNTYFRVPQAWDKMGHTG